MDDEDSNTPVDDPWSLTLARIENFLAQDGVHAFHIGTTLDIGDRAVSSWAICKAAQRIRQDAVVIFLVSTLLEKQLAYRHFVYDLHRERTDPLVTPVTEAIPNTDQIGILTYADFVRIVHDKEDSCFPADLVVVANCELSLSQDAVLAHSMIIEHIKLLHNEKSSIPGQSVHLLTFGLVANHCSEHRAYRAYLENEIKVQLHKSPWSPDIVGFSDDDNKELEPVVNEASRCIRDCKHVVSFLEEDLTEKIMRLARQKARSSNFSILDPVHVELSSNTALRGTSNLFRNFDKDRVFRGQSTFVTIKPFATSTVLPILNTGMVISCLSAGTNLEVDKDRGGLLVRRKRRYSVLEILLQHACVNGASPLTPAPRVFCMYTRVMVDGLASFPPHRFLNDEILKFVFEATCYYPGRELGDIDFCIDRDDMNLVREMQRRLLRMKVLQPFNNGFKICGEQGRRLHRDLLPLYPPNFNACVLLACLDRVPLKVQRILVRLGAIALYAPRLIDFRLPRICRADLDALALECWGKDQGLGLHGNLWMMLGLVARTLAIQKEQECKMERAANDIVELDEKTVSDIEKAIQHVERLYHMDPAWADDLRDALNNKELRLVQERLMRAWFDKLVVLALANDLPYDMMSGQPIRIDESGFFSLKVLREIQPEDSKDMVHLGIALDVEEEMDETDVYAWGVTRLPWSLCHIVEDETGLGLVEAFSSTLP